MFYIGDKNVNDFYTVSNFIFCRHLHGISEWYVFTHADSTITCKDTRTIECIVDLTCNTRNGYFMTFYSYISTVLGILWLPPVAWSCIVSKVKCRPAVSTPKTMVKVTVEYQ